MEAEAFWVVWCPTGGAPTYRHTAKSLAVTEAERLARLHPGQTFIVLRSECDRMYDAMVRIEHSEPIPF